MPYLHVIKPGSLSLIQDFGRFGYTQMGVTNGGPADDYAFSWANRLLGNDNQCCCIEITLGQASFEFTAPGMFSIAGGDLNAKLDGTPIANWSTFYARKNQVLKFSLPKNGLRSYLAVNGGFDIKKTSLGSVATVARDNLGGLEGNGSALKSGDKISYHSSSQEKPLSLSFRYIPDYNLPLKLRVIESYQSKSFSLDAKQDFYNNEYAVSQLSDRMGYRLEGQPIDSGHINILSEGIALGSIQIPPDGRPIILLNDRQTIGGYPKLGCVARIDLPRLAQAKPGQKVTFEKGDREGLQEVWCKWARYLGY